MNVYRLGLTIAAVALTAAACDQSPTAAPATGGYDAAAALAGADPTGAAYEVTVCKDGPAGTYDFTASTTTAGGAVTLPAGASFQLTAGDAQSECKLAASGNGNATIAEVVANLPSNVVFDKVVVKRYFTGTGTFDQITESTNPQQTLASFGNDFGWVLIYINVPAPSTGCTLTQGYWKTHNASFAGGAPVDPEWANIGALKELELFFSTGMTWFEIFWTPVGGNAYYNLAHQYMAAKLNYEAGATAPASVMAALSHAETLLGGNSIAYVGGLKGNDALRKDFVDTAGVLGSYNEGLIGPGHCGD